MVKCKFGRKFCHFPAEIQMLAFLPAFIRSWSIISDNISFGDIIIPSATLTHLRSLFKSYLFYRRNLSHLTLAPLPANLRRAFPFPVLTGSPSSLPHTSHLPLHHLHQLRQHPLYLPTLDPISNEVHIVQKLIGQFLIHVPTISCSNDSDSSKFCLSPFHLLNANHSVSWEDTHR